MRFIDISKAQAIKENLTYKIYPSPLSLQWAEVKKKYAKLECLNIFTGFTYLEDI